MSFASRLFAAAATGCFLMTTAAAQAWAVYQKTSPCQDTRQDWFTVAQTYPGGPSTNDWRLFQGNFATFAAAMAAADIAKTGPNFRSACCHDWAVFRNTETGGFSVGRTTAGPHPSNLMQVTGPMCCEAAFNQAGFPVGQIRDCRNLLLSTGKTITLRPGGNWVDATVAPPSPAPPNGRSASPCNGTFYAANGSVYHLKVSGNTVTGDYAAGAGAHSGIRGTLQGTVSGNLVSVQYAAREGQVTGTGTMTLTCGPNGTISGSYRSSDGRFSGPMALKNQPPTPNPPGPPNPPNPPNPPGQGNVTLQLIQTIPDNRSDSGIRVSDWNVSQTVGGEHGEVSWNPPGTMDSSGVVITIRTLIKNGAVSAGMSGDFILESPSGGPISDKLAFATTNGPNDTKTGGAQVRVRPRLPVRDGQILQLNIGMSFVAGVTYKFRAVVR